MGTREASGGAADDAAQTPSLGMAGHAMAHTAQRKETRTTINLGLTEQGGTVWLRVYKSSTAPGAAPDEHTVMRQDQTAASAARRIV